MIKKHIPLVYEIMIDFKPITIRRAWNNSSEIISNFMKPVTEPSDNDEYLALSLPLASSIGDSSRLNNRYLKATNDATIGHKEVVNDMRYEADEFVAHFFNSPPLVRSSVLVSPPPSVTLSSFLLHMIQKVTKCASKLPTLRAVAA